MMETFLTTMVAVLSALSRKVGLAVTVDVIQFVATALSRVKRSVTTTTQLMEMDAALSAQSNKAGLAMVKSAHPYVQMA